MSKLGIFMADGCEEIEGLTVVDLVRRAGIEIEMISVNGKKSVTGSHKITFQTDIDKADADYTSYDGIVLPGGMPGTTHLMEDETVNRVIREFASEGKLVAAICAAPSVLGNAGLLAGDRNLLSGCGRQTDRSRFCDRSGSKRRQHYYEPRPWYGNRLCSRDRCLSQGSGSRKISEGEHCIPRIAIYLK